MDRAGGMKAKTNVPYCEGVIAMRKGKYKKDKYLERFGYELEKVGYEVERAERKAFKLQRLETIAMYTDGIFEMARYDPEDSGLPFTVWFDAAGTNKCNERKAPRIKIFIAHKLFIPISIEGNPKILLKATQLRKAVKVLGGREKEMKAIYEFIARNRGLILRHWYGEISITELFSSLQ
jgi:hypothetical protein